MPLQLLGVKDNRTLRVYVCHFEFTFQKKCPKNLLRGMIRGRLSFYIYRFYLHGKDKYSNMYQRLGAKGIKAFPSSFNIYKLNSLSKWCPQKAFIYQIIFLQLSIYGLPFTIYKTDALKPKSEIGSEFFSICFYNLNLHPKLWFSKPFLS